MIWPSYNARMMPDVTCVAQLALMEHASIVCLDTTFKPQLALHVLLTVIHARAALNALNAVMATTLTRTVAAQRVQIRAVAAIVQQSAQTVIRVIVSMALFAKHAVLPTALNAMSRTYAHPALTET